MPVKFNRVMQDGCHPSKRLTFALRFTLVAAQVFVVAVSAAMAAEVDMTTVLPSKTDAAISKFDTPHRIYLRRDIAS
ncbi:MAG: hypothetical protein HYZ36_02080, partial [Pedosphaera parvula]|nr:hypothetical protein [Pedosphaera parvula]